MNISPSGALAVELHPHSPTQWVATYYPMVTTPAGRWAEVTWTLHEHVLPRTSHPLEPARWLELRSPDPDHPCYIGHEVWAPELSAGYAAALAVHGAEAAEEPLALRAAEQLDNGTVVVPAGQLSEWVLDDLEDQPSDIRG